MQGAGRATSAAVLIFAFLIADGHCNFKIFAQELKGETYNEAKCYEHFINQGYSDYRVYNNYGAILKSFRKFREAELYTRKALEIKPNYPSAYYNLGCIFIDIKKLKEAEVYTRKALQLKSDLVDANYNLGFILRDLGKLEESESYLLKTIKLNSEYPKAYMILSTLNYSKDKITGHLQSPHIDKRDQRLPREALQGSTSRRNP